MDKIIIKGLRVFAYHGVNPEEKENGQNFILDITCYININIAARSDNLDDTVSYARILKAVCKSFTEKKFDLIEAAAQHVIDSIFEGFHDIRSVDLTLKKPEAPINAEFDYVAVCLTRER